MYWRACKFHAIASAVLKVQPAPALGRILGVKSDAIVDYRKTITSIPDRWRDSDCSRGSWWIPLPLLVGIWSTNEALRCRSSTRPGRRAQTRTSLSCRALSDRGRTRLSLDTLWNGQRLNWPVLKQIRNRILNQRIDVVIYSNLEE